MEWNAKWDWENFVTFGLKSTENLIVDEGDIYPTSFNLSGGSGSSGVSCSEGGHGSSAKSSLSTSTDSTFKGIQMPNLRFKEGGNLREKLEIKGTCPPLEASVGCAEPLIGLKLGKRTYFEDSVSLSNAKCSSFYGIPFLTKKTKSSSQNSTIPRCQVDDCNLDLSMAKEYHQKHRVCDSHSKSPEVLVGGIERRFCQQCSRFHSLSEFDDKKRSCRRRLSDHNARRRKPQPEAIQMNTSTRPSSSFYGGRQHLNFLLNNASGGAPVNSSWDGSHNLSQGTSHTGRLNLASKIFMSDVLNAGYKGDVVSAHKDTTAQGLGLDRALSLLSSNAWGSSLPPESMQEGDIGGITQPPMHEIPESMPHSSSEIWLPSAHPSTDPPNIHDFSLLTSNHYQEIPLFKPPYHMF